MIQIILIEFPLFRRNYAFCVTVSRDLWNQRKTTQFNSPLSMFFSKSSHIRIKADRVECLGRKPD
jgi:hypothetical protein